MTGSVTMTVRIPVLGLAGLALLAACAEPAATPPPATGTAAAAPAPPPPPRGPVTRFDGRYTGSVSLLPDRTRACPEGPTQEREITVRNGRAAFAFNPQTRQVLTGTVGPEGSSRMADQVDRTIATSGLFTENGFRGEHKNGLCHYAVQMTKRS
jgi:hypothetical protein